MLGGGGTLGDAWMCSVLAGLEESGRVDLPASGGFVGTSAGSMVATRLAAEVNFSDYVRGRLARAGADPVGPFESPVGAGPEIELEPPVQSVHRLGAATLPLGGPAGRWIRRSMLGRIPDGGEDLVRLGESMDRLAPEWDPRLNIVGLETATGKRVVFRRDEDHGLTVGQAVRASCAIPGVFRPVENNGRSYVDGGVWSPANLDAVASRKGETVLALLPIGAAPESGNPWNQLLFETFRSIVAGEVIRLRNRGVRVLMVAPDRDSGAAIGPDRMDSSREAMVGRAGLAQGHALAGPLARRLTTPA